MAAAAAVALAKNVRTSPSVSPLSRKHSFSPQSLGTATPKSSTGPFGASCLAPTKYSRPTPPELEAVCVEEDAKSNGRGVTRIPTLLGSKHSGDAVSGDAVSVVSRKQNDDRSRGTNTHSGSVGTRGTKAFTRQRGFATRLFPGLGPFVDSDRFETMIAACIVANCATMGIQADQLLGKAASLESFVAVSEHVFTAIFLAELLLRGSFQGWHTYIPFNSLGGSVWNFLDMQLVLVTGVLAVWILPLFGVVGFEELQVLTVLRAFRLMRLVRVAQRVESFHDVWLLLRGLMESGRVLFWTVVVVFLITYMFAIFGVVLIGAELRDSYDEAIASSGIGDGADIATLKGLVEITDGVFPMMYTLIQVLTLDSWTSVARPIQEYASWSWLFFYLYIAVAVIVMMNLVTAVIVENALKNSQKDGEEQLAQREREKQEELAHFRHMFQLLDLDGNQEVTWDEFETAFEDPQLSTNLQLHGISPENCREMFDLLDTGDGAISMEEFFDGITKMEGQAMSADLFRSSKAVESISKLITQQHLELREDLSALVQLIAPGAKLPERTNSLKQRRKATKSPPRTGTPTDDASSTKNTPAVSAFVKPHVQVDAATSSDQMLARLTGIVASIAESVADSRREVREDLDTCSKRISTFTADLADLRNGRRSGEDLRSSAHTLQSIESVSPRNRLATIAAGCAPSGAGVCSYPFLSGGVAAGATTPQPRSEWASRLEIAREGARCCCREPAELKDSCVSQKSFA